MPLAVERVESNRQIREFAVLPAVLYRHENGYVPPLDFEQVEVVHPKKSPFFAHGRAAYWIARRDGVACGRISAQFDDLLPQPDDGRLGLFGCLDAVNDAEVVRALTAAAEDWLRAQGCTRCRGPFVLSINGQSGLLVSGQERSPMTLMPWHPAYLDGLVRTCGYGVAKVLNSYELDFDVARTNPLFNARRPVRQPGTMTVRRLRMHDLRAEMELCRTLFNDAWKNNWGFTPMADAEMRAFVKNFRYFLFPECGMFVETGEGPIAFAILLPNFYEITSDLGTAPGILGWIRLLIRMRRQAYGSVRVVMMGVAERYQKSATAAAALLTILAEMAKAARARNVTRGEAGWILEDNYPMIRVLEAVGFSVVRTYNVYEKSLGAVRAGTAGTGGEGKGQ